MVGAARLDYRVLRRLATPAYLLAAVLLLPVDKAKQVEHADQKRRGQRNIKRCSLEELIDQIAFFNFRQQPEFVAGVVECDATDVLSVRIGIPSEGDGGLTL